MLKRFAYIATTLVVLAACGGGSGAGLAALFGNDFAAAFAQGPNDTPRDQPNLALVLTPNAVPINP